MEGHLGSQGRAAFDFLIVVYLQGTVRFKQIPIWLGGRKGQSVNPRALPPKVGTPRALWTSWAIELEK
jgi:hypothetical protein